MRIRGASFTHLKRAGKFMFQRRVWLPSPIRPGIYRVGFSNLAETVTFEPHIIETDQLVNIASPIWLELEKEVNRFWSLKSTFEKYGFLHKRGVLLYGPPGTGKNVLYYRISEHFLNNFRGISLLADSAFLYNRGIEAVRKIDPNIPILILLEELDELIKDYNDGPVELIKALEGSNSRNGVLTVAITNNLNLIPDNIKNRPGRFDALYERGLLSGEEVSQFLAAKLKGFVSQEEQTRLISLCAPLQWTFASLKEVLVLHLAYGYPPEKCISRVQGTFFESQGVGIAISR